MSECLVSEYIEESTEMDNFKGGISENTYTISELECLINILKKGIKNNEPAIKFIKYPNLLVDALEELNNLVGMHRLKDSVALQTVRLIENLKEGEKSMAMLNTCLSGLPGCGKTKAGVVFDELEFRKYVWDGVNFEIDYADDYFQLPETLPFPEFPPNYWENLVENDTIYIPLNKIEEIIKNGSKYLTGKFGEKYKIFTLLVSFKTMEEKFNHFVKIDDKVYANFQNYKAYLI